MGAAIPGSVPGYRRVAAATGWALGVGACLAILVAAAGRPHEAYFDAQVQLGGARDILAGANPYGAYYQSPLWSAFVLVPFAALREGWSYVAWFWANVLSWAAAVLLLAKVAGIPGGLPARILTAGLLMVYPPAVWSMHGQLDGFMALGLAGSLALSPSKPFAAGLTLTALAVKPHLALFPLALLLLSAMRDGRWAVVLGLLTGSLVIAVLSLAAQPAWPLQWLNVLAHPPVDMVLGRAKFAQTMAAFTGLWTPGWLAGALGWTVAVTTALAAAKWVWTRPRAPADVAALGAAGLFLVTPYAQGYDLSLLLLPLAITAGRALQITGLPRAALLAGVVFVSLFAMTTAYLEWPQPVLVLSSPITLVLWWLSRRWGPKSNVQSPKPPPNRFETFPLPQGEG